VPLRGWERENKAQSPFFKGGTGGRLCGIKKGEV